MKKNIEYDFFELFDQFISLTQKGRRLQKNGKRIRKDSLKNYVYLRKLLFSFSTTCKFPLVVRPVWSNDKRILRKEQKYWKKFYRELSLYLYDKKGYYDNYVSSQIKLLRAFFNYLQEEKGMPLRNMHKGLPILSE